MSAGLVTLLQAAEYLERRERGKIITLFICNLSNLSKLETSTLLNISFG